MPNDQQDITNTNQLRRDRVIADYQLTLFILKALVKHDESTTLEQLRFRGNHWQSVPT